MVFTTCTHLRLQVSLPHYRDAWFLKSAILRYRKYLFLKQSNPDLFLVPCYDFDLVWHSHQLHPHLYKVRTDIQGTRSLPNFYCTKNMSHVRQYTNPGA